MILNMQHDDFDMTMELICLLPLDGSQAVIKDVISDLRMDKQVSLKPHVARAKTQFGIDLVTEIADRMDHTKAGRVVSIAPHSLSKARIEGNTYWSKVYF